MLLAADCGQIDIVNFLIGKGAKLESKDYDGNTPLFLAARHSFLTIMKTLLSNGADIEARDSTVLFNFLYFNIIFF